MTDTSTPIKKEPTHNEKIQLALNARKKRSAASPKASATAISRSHNDRIEMALSARKQRIQATLPDVFSDIQKGIISQIDTYNNMQQPSFGSYKDTYNSQREQRINISDLRSKVSAYRNYMDDSTADSLLSVLDQMENGYDAYLTMSTFETEEDYNAALQDYNYRQKYGGKSYTEINNTLATMADGVERDWLTAYAPTVMTAEDYDRKIAEVNKSLEIKEADLNRYEDAIKNLAAGSAVREMIINEINEKYGSRTGLEEQIEQLKADRYTYENEKKYNLLSENADFEEQSKVMATEQTSNLLDSLFGTAQHHYDYINGFLKTDLDRTERYKFSPNAEPGEDAKYLSNSIVDMFAGYLSFMSDTEKDRYNYLYNTQGAESAEEYLKYLENTLSSRAMSYTQEEWEALTTQLPLQSSMVSVPLNLWSGIGYADVLGQKLVKDIQEDVTGEYTGPINYNSAAMLPAVTSSTIRGTTAQNLADEYGVINFNEEEHPILSTLLNGKSWGDVYQLGMSMVDSAAVAVTSPVLGTAGTLMLSGSAATRSVLDAVANGATDEQALWMGAMSGAFEYLFEKYELESLLKNGSENAIRAFVSQGLSEGFGEGATTIANRVADSLIMADKSQLNRSIAAYMEANPGMTREKALQKALTDMAVQVGWDTVGGMASGSIMGSGASVIKNAANAINRNGETGDQIKDVYGSDVLSLISETLEIDPNNTLAQRLQTKLNNSKDISSSEIQSLVRANQAAIQKQDISTIQKAAQGRLAELGETGDITAISSVLAKQAAGQNLTRQERQAVSNSRYGSRVANELDPDNIRSGEYSTAWAQQIGTDRINAEAYNSVQEDTLTDREVLEWAVKSVDFKTMKPQVREALKSFQSHLQQRNTIQSLLQQEQRKLRQAGSAYEQQKAQSNINRLNQILSRQEKKLQTLEKTPALKQLLEKARSEASKTTIPNTENRRKETVANPRTYDRISADSGSDVLLSEAIAQELNSNTKQNIESLTNRDILDRIGEFLDTATLSGGQHTALSAYGQQRQILSDLETAKQGQEKILNWQHSRHVSTASLQQTQDRITALDTQINEANGKLQQIEKRAGIRSVVNKAKNRIYANYLRTMTDIVHSRDVLQVQGDTLQNLYISLQNISDSPDSEQCAILQKRIAKKEAQIEEINEQLRHLNEQIFASKSLASAIIDPTDRNVLLFDNKKVVTVNGRCVILVEGLFDPNYIDKKGRTNMERLSKGLAPIGNDDAPLNVHHLDQTDDGIVVAIPKTLHQKYDSMLHSNTGQAPSQINRDAFNKWRKAYWQWISQQKKQ